MIQKYALIAFSQIVLNFDKNRQKNRFLRILSISWTKRRIRFKSILTNRFGIPSSCSDFTTMLILQVRKKFHENFSRCCQKSSVCSLLRIIFICITEGRWVIDLLLTGRCSCLYVKTNHGIFTQIFQWQIRFCWAMAPQSQDVTPLDFFLLGRLKNKIFATAPAIIGELKRHIAMGNSEHYSENVAKGFPKYDALHCYV